MRVIPLIASAVLLGFLTHEGLAATFTLNGQSYTTQFNTGSGPDNALMVLEFGASTYAFGYSWNPASSTPSGYDMLTAITTSSGSAPSYTYSGSPPALAGVIYSGGNMTFNASFFDFGDGPEPFVNTVGYLANQPISDYPNSWFNYFTADGGSDWSNSFVGVGDRVLADGSADDFVFQDIPPDENFNPLVVPAFAIAVPEPASLAMLGVGLALMVRPRRVSR